MHSTVVLIYMLQQVFALLERNIWAEAARLGQHGLWLICPLTDRYPWLDAAPLPVIDVSFERVIYIIVGVASSMISIIPCTA